MNSALKKLLMGVLFIILPLTFCTGQVYFRIEASYSVKEQALDGFMALQMGKVYFDKKVQHITYKNFFPKKETIVVSDTLMVSVIPSGQKSAIKSYGLVSFSVFNILLQGDLANYGLRKLPYAMTNVIKEDSLVISTWQSTENIEQGLDKIMIAQHDKKLFSFVGFNKKGEMVTQQFYEDYRKIDGLFVPTKIISFYFIDGKKTTKWLTLKDIKLNNTGNNAEYSLTISDVL